MSLKLTSITLNTGHLEAMLNFYQILGIDFTETRVDKGSQVCRALIEGCEFSIYSAKSMEKSNTPILQISFLVSQLDEKVRQLCEVPGVICIMDPTPLTDGKKAIVLDPDGHSIELKEA